MGQLANIIRPLVFANWCLSHRFYISTFPQRLRYGVLSSLMITFQRDVSQVLEKDIPECKTGKSLSEDLYLKKDRESIYDCKFSEVKML